jgi:hypothetical protein
MTDPATSHQAANSIDDDSVTSAQALILRILAMRPMHDQMLHAEYCSLACSMGLPFISESGCRSRRSELVAMGKVKDTGARIKLPSGRNSIVWQTVKEGI